MPAKGDPKTGGRKKGTPNRVTPEVRDFVDRVFEAIDPKKFAVDLLKCRDLNVRAKVFISLLQWKYGKPVQPITGKDGGPIVTQIVNHSARPQR